MSAIAANAYSTVSGHLHLPSPRREKPKPLAGSRLSQRETLWLCRRYVALPLMPPDNDKQSALTNHGSHKHGTPSQQTFIIYTSNELHLTFKQMERKLTAEEWYEHIIIPAFIILIWVILLENF